MRFPFPPHDSVVSMQSPEAPEQSPEQAVTLDEVVNQVAIATETSTPALTAESPQLMPDPVMVATQTPADVVPPLPEADPGPQPAIQPRPRPRRKVIAFPRQGTPETGHRLADPVLPEQPRILDVPEELEAFPSTPFLEGLQFELATRTSAFPADHVELPFRSVSLSRRVCAALLDCSLVAVAALVFALIGHKMLPTLALTKTARIVAALLPVLLWAIYQYLLLVYAGRTVGMQVTTIRLTTFKGRRPSLRHRRNRVLGLYLSTASLVMGLLWAFVDVDALCWHDRISGTYLTKRE